MLSARSNLLVATVCLLGVLLAASAQAADSAGISGVFVTTKYPSQSVRAEEAISVDLTINNYQLPPQRVDLSVSETADGWKATLLGGGQPISAAIVRPNEEERIQLRLEPPADIPPGRYAFAIEAMVDGAVQRLPLEIRIDEEAAARLRLSANLPSLRGSPSATFRFRVTVSNDSGRDGMINFGTDLPRGFLAVFTEAYGSQELTSIPIEAGRSKEIEVAVTPPRDIKAGNYPFKFNVRSEQAAADIDLEIVVAGQPRLALSGEGGRLSAKARAGAETPVTLVLRNDGTEVAQRIELTASTPAGWKAEFDRSTVDEIGAGETVQVTALLTPSDRAIAGDYQMSFRASGSGGAASESASFRITVDTSTWWGIVGIAVIASALVVVGVAVARFGRR